MGFLGSKSASGAYQAIIALMPPHDTYIELFAGSGAVMLRKPAAARNIAVDLDVAAVANLALARKDVETYTADAIAWIAGFDYTAAGRVLIYADPPYLHSTRTSHSRYEFELTDAQHEELVDALRSVPASVIISGYPSEQYDWWLSDWHTKEFQAMTRGGPRTEKLWYNFDPVATQWARYAGNDFTDRQRIKRKAARWAAKYAVLPPGERLAIMAALLETSSSGIDESDDAYRQPETAASMIDCDL